MGTPHPPGDPKKKPDEHLPLRRTPPGPHIPGTASASHVPDLPLPAAGEVASVTGNLDNATGKAVQDTAVVLRRTVHFTAGPDPQAAKAIPLGKYPGPRPGLRGGPAFSRAGRAHRPGGPIHPPALGNLPGRTGRTSAK